MAGIKNKYDFYKGFLEALGAEGINETDYKNEEELRKKILDTLDVEYVFDDVNQTDLFREKFLQGIGSGGGGDSDFSTAEVTVTNNLTVNGVALHIPLAIDDVDTSYSTGDAFIEHGQSITMSVILFKELALATYNTEASDFEVTVTGSIVHDSQYGELQISGNGTVSFDTK